MTDQERKNRIYRTLMMQGKMPYNYNDMDAVVNKIEASQPDPYCDYEGVSVVVCCDPGTGRIWYRDLKPEESDAELLEKDFIIVDPRWRDRRMIKKIITCYYYNWFPYLDDADDILPGIEISEEVYRKAFGGARDDNRDAEV